MERLIGLLGIILLLGIAFLISNNRKAINYKTVGVGLLAQILLAVFVLKVPLGQKIVLAVGLFIQKVLEFAKIGGEFAFGNLIDDTHIFIVQLICSIIFMMVIVNILYYYKIMQRVILVLGKAMNKLMDLSGAEAFSAVANAFVGQIVAQVMIKPYLEKLSKSELLSSMTGSMACLSGALIPVYIAMGVPAQYVLASSIMAIPGAIVTSKIVFPETTVPETAEGMRIGRRRPFINVFAAISSGASEGIMVAIKVSAMLVALIALVAMIDWCLGGFGNFLYNTCHLTVPVLGLDLQNLSLKMIIGKIFAIFAYAIGVPMGEATTVGSLMGTKIVLNEMVAYVDMVSLKDILSPKSFMIATFALCSFGNFGSIAMQIGGIGELAPNQRKNLAKLGLRALICGTMTCYISAAIAGILLF